MNDLGQLCVFCGANQGAAAVYQEAAADLGRAMAARGIGLVYGGGSVGLMGIIARTVNGAGGRVTGIIPSALMRRELSGETLGELIVVRTMHERKARMTETADGFIAMPGGFGTLDELFEALTWGQLGIHAKPIGLLNVAGYFDPLLSWIDHALGQGFIRPQHRGLFVVADDPSTLLDAMTSHEPPADLVRWLKLDQA